MNDDTQYTRPTLTVVGSLHELTLTVKDPTAADGITVKGVGPVGS